MNILFDDLTIPTVTGKFAHIRHYERTIGNNHKGFLKGRRCFKDYVMPAFKELYA